MERALILQLVPYRDNDLMLTLLAERRGRVSCSAPGGRSSRRRFEAGLDKLYLAEVELVEARNGRLRLASSRLLEAFDGLRGSLEQAAGAELLSEVVRMAAGQGPEGAALFEPVTSLLGVLAATPPERAGAVTWASLIWLLARMGFIDARAVCTRCGDPEARHFSLIDRALRCDAHRPGEGGAQAFSEEGLRLFRAAAAGELGDFARGDIPEEARKRLGLYAEVSLQEILSQPPRSLGFFREMQV